MLLNLHGELAEQPSSSDPEKGKNSLLEQQGIFTSPEESCQGSLPQLGDEDS